MLARMLNVQAVEARRLLSLAEATQEAREGLAKTIGQRECLPVAEFNPLIEHTLGQLVVFLEVTDEVVLIAFWL